MRCPHYLLSGKRRWACLVQLPSWHYSSGHLVPKWRYMWSGRIDVNTTSYWQHMPTGMILHNPVNKSSHVRNLSGHTELSYIDLYTPKREFLLYEVTLTCCPFSVYLTIYAICLSVSTFFFLSYRMKHVCLFWLWLFTIAASFFPCLFHKITSGPCPHDMHSRYSCWLHHSLF